MDLDFHTLDVFTDRIFGGNPLGVVPEADRLPVETMQKIARELNLSETVFLSAPETAEGTRRARIFTPEMEVPFAGHPTVGAAYFLAATGAVELSADGGRLVLEENVGPVPVDVELEDGHPTRTRLTAAVPPQYRRCPWSDEELGRMISLPADAIGCETGRGSAGLGLGLGRLEPDLVSVGLPFIVVPVRDIAAVRGSRLDTAVWERLTTGAWSRMVYVVTVGGVGNGVDLHVRMYAPEAGVPEDPATGSAAAALAAYLGARTGRSESYAWAVEQGLEMGRPSRIDIEVDVTDASVREVRVGGRSVLVSSGTMRLP